MKFQVEELVANADVVFIAMHWAKEERMTNR